MNEPSFSPPNKCTLQQVFTIDHNLQILQLKIDTTVAANDSEIEQQNEVDKKNKNEIIEKKNKNEIIEQQSKMNTTIIVKHVLLLNEIDKKIKIANREYKLKKIKNAEKKFDFYY